MWYFLNAKMAISEIFYFSLLLNWHLSHNVSSTIHKLYLSTSFSLMMSESSFQNLSFIPSSTKEIQRCSSLYFKNSILQYCIIWLWFSELFWQSKSQKMKSFWASLTKRSNKCFMMSANPLTIFILNFLAKICH